MKRKLLGALVVMGFIAGACKDEMIGERPLELANDGDYVVSVVVNSRGEIELAKLVSAKGTDPNLKAFAAAMSSYHTTALNEATSLAGTKSITLPEGFFYSDENAFKGLDTLTGYQFDSLYVRTIVDKRAIAVGVAENQIRNGKDQDITTYARKDLEALRNYSATAQELEASLIVED